MIDIGYLWGIKWAEKFSTSSERIYGILLIGFTAIMFILAIFMNVYGYIIVADEFNYMEKIGKIS